MGREFSVQEALKLAIKAEKDSMDFYRLAASLTKNQRAREVLTLLANEEASHLSAFFNHYKGGEFGDLKSYMETAPDDKNPAYMKLKKGLDGELIEQSALELALAEEKQCIGQYSQFAKDIVDPMVRSIFLQVVKETERHYELIESEYAHVMKMVHETDQNIYVRE